MATFTADQQKQHREQFINDCRQKAWGASCHADWIAKGMEEAVAMSANLSAERRRVDEEIKATDYKTPESRGRMKMLHERRDAIPGQLKMWQAHIQQGQKVLNGLYASIESNLALAKHAEAWEWKEVRSTAAKTEEITGANMNGS